MEVVKCFSFACLGFFLGIYIAIITMIDVPRRNYKNCRYYDQTIERCVAELGWEKK
jgi:hypothetical protein